ncbi:hypothetical protein DPEC_G00287360 [Dallia pectoralis]|uniref:Uncharacterized protein n=1 Tax=Dallia pectoralis TaxID=75939 RepID=A0ACC2FK65_DALPE|nr:hypothetical protein DPEC_G00287360 [Dallia pectoralis]
MLDECKKGASVKQHEPDTNSTPLTQSSNHIPSSFHQAIPSLPPPYPSLTTVFHFAPSSLHPPRVIRLGSSHIFPAETFHVFKAPV